MIVAIVGRPNVGKSTLFNRLTESKHAIVDEVSGVTRDRLYGHVDWNGKEFSVIDTGGYIKNSEDIFEEEIRNQVTIAIQEANIILFMVDVTSGITDLDIALTEILRKTDKEIFLVVNKVDNNERLYDANEFYKLGLGELFCISSINGNGTGDLLDKITDSIYNKAEEEEELIPKYAVVGRPNVGKSSMINVLIGEKRNIVTHISGTTRDSIHTRYQKFGHDFYLVDTAGIRKKGKVSENLEFYSVLRAIRSIEQADVCILMIDATLGVEAQDMNIFKLIIKNKKGVVIAINKWDLIEKTTNSAKEYIEKVKKKIAPFVDVPIIFTSTIKKQRIHKILEEAVEVFKNKTKRISTSVLNEIILQEIQAYPPPAVKGKHIRIKYVSQLGTPHPAFAFFCNLPQYVREPYKRFLENKLRKHFNFSGTPIQIYMRKK